MKTPPSRRAKAGYISTLLVLSTGAILSILTLYAYRAALTAQAVQTQVQLRVDYSEKEEAILRSIVAITPNRAIRAMQSGSKVTAVSDPLRWQNIFTEALVLANARTAISSELLASLGLNLRQANSGDSALGMPSRIFTAISPATGYISPGINRTLGPSYPVPLDADDTVKDLDVLYPIIAKNKVYGTLAQSGVGLPVATYRDFNLMKYPNINFGYAKPGDNFVAKRNWWAFSLDVAEHDYSMTYLAKQKRDFVLSIYEIPSQLAISASSFMSLGQFAGGADWQNVTISGGVFVGKAQTLGSVRLPTLASRRSIALSSTTQIPGIDASVNPLAPGEREKYQDEQDKLVPVSLTNQVTLGAFSPISLSSESGRSAFIPINRGKAFFDRFDPVENAGESNSLSPTTWNNYSIGANRCAMCLDVTRVIANTQIPNEFRFSYLKNNARNIGNDYIVKVDECPPGYGPIRDEKESVNFGTEVVDVAYGLNGSYYYKNKVTGSVTFNNTTFGDPLVGVGKKGYMRLPFEQLTLPNSIQPCVAVYPMRFKAFLAALQYDSLTVNNSLVVNVDYLNLGSTYPRKPEIPCTPNDLGLILKECADLRAYSKGFSLVTNLRLYIGDDFNTSAGTPPVGYTPTSVYYPPCSLFAPEKRYGVDIDPFNVVLGGQIGSLAPVDKVNLTDDEIPTIRPLDSKVRNGTPLGAANITVNLRPITHPADLPPITMMNWLVLLEERRKEYY